LTSLGTLCQPIIWVGPTLAFQPLQSSRLAPPAGSRIEETDPNCGVSPRSLNEPIAETRNGIRKSPDDIGCRTRGLRPDQQSRHGSGSGRTEFGAGQRRRHLAISLSVVVDNYAEGRTQVSAHDHRNWLRVLATGRSRVLSATFSGCQNRGLGNAARNERVAAFHNDEVELYPHSLVFEYGNFQTGLKIRWPANSIDHVIANLRQMVEAAWNGWSFSMNTLTVHLDGHAAN
jgi:hypothetical protein